jgi:hypothetical protein
MLLGMRVQSNMALRVGEGYRSLLNKNIKPLSRTTYKDVAQ